MTDFEKLEYRALEIERLEHIIEILESSINKGLVREGIIEYSYYDIVEVINILSSYKKSLAHITEAKLTIEEENIKLREENIKLKINNKALAALIKKEKQKNSLIVGIAEIQEEIKKDTDLMVDIGKTLAETVNEHMDAICTSANMKNNTIERNKSKGKINTTVAIQLYNDLWSIKDIADKFGVSYQAVRKRLIDSGIQLRDERRK